jgi:hypothetical protein
VANQFQAWSEAEESIICNHYAEISAVEVQRIFLPHRSLGAIQTRASRLGVSWRPGWTEREDDVLRKWFPLESAEEVAARLDGRTVPAVYQRAAALGIEKAPGALTKGRGAEGDALIAKILADDEALSRFWGKTRRERGCWVWTAYVHPENGHGQVGTYGRIWSAHRLAYMLHHKEHIDDDVLVTQVCGNRACVNPTHLRTATLSEVIQAGYDCGERVAQPLFGEEHPNAKLTAKQVQEIRSKRGKVTVTGVARTYSISKTHASDLMRGRHWRHVAPLPQQRLGDAR